MKVVTEINWAIYLFMSRRFLLMFSDTLLFFNYIFILLYWRFEFYWEIWEKRDKSQSKRAKLIYLSSLCQEIVKLSFKKISKLKKLININVAIVCFWTWFEYIESRHFVFIILRQCFFIVSLYKLCNFVPQIF